MFLKNSTSLGSQYLPRDHYSFVERNVDVSMAVADRTSSIDEETRDQFLLLGPNSGQMKFNLCTVAD